MRGACVRALALAVGVLTAGPLAAQEDPDAPDAASVLALPAPPPGPSADATVPAPGTSVVAEEPSAALTIERAAEGAVRLSGTAPSATAEAEVLRLARGVAGGENTVASSLTIKEDGLPDDWQRLTREAFAALGGLVSGQAVIDAGRLELEGVAEDPRARERALAALSEGDWHTEIDVQLELAEPYTFSAEQTESGITYAGHAPDEPTAASLEAMIEEVAGAEAEGEMTLARGIPGEDWPQLVRAGLVALTHAETGSLLIEDRDVSLTAEVADTGASRRLSEQLGTGWQVDLTIRDPSPEPELTVTVQEDGLEATGRLPEALGTEPLTDMLGPIDTSSGLSADAYGQRRAWRDAVDALAIAVPRMRRGRIVMSDGQAHFDGALKEGFSASDLRGALRATLGSEWEIGLEIGEAPPPSQLEIVRTPEGLDIDGILPEGVRPEQVLGDLGPDTTDVSTGGEGDRWAWRRQLRRAARALRAFETGGARIEGRTITLTGTLQPGYTAEEISDWLGARLDEGWKVAVEAEDRPGAQGDRRVSLHDGGVEVLRYGHWLPVHEFEASPEKCDAMLAEAAAGRRVVFVPGSSDIGEGQARLLDRLAGVIRHCVTEGGLELEVQGHTDDQGEAAENLLLSEARAIQVVLELAERGVPAKRLKPVGYGETRPIADNETPAGRARNRRISFAWSG